MKGLPLVSTDVRALETPGSPGRVQPLAARQTAGERAVLALVSVALVLLYAPTVLWLLDRWTMSVWHHAHGLLIPFVVGYLVREELRVRRHLPRSASAWGFAFLVPALVLHAIDAGMHTQLLSAFSIVVLLPGLSLLFLGRERTRPIVFLLAFLVFMLPIPLTFTEGIHLALRQVATAGSAALVPLFGIPIYVEGTTIHMAHATLLVADACSGFSTLYAAMALACLIAYSTPSTWRRVALLLVAPVVAVAANIIRVVLLVLLVYWQGTEILGTSLHTISGLFTFALALPIIFWVGQGGRTNAPASRPS
jgi:exosortase